MGCCSSTLSHDEVDDTRRRNGPNNGFGQQPQQTLTNVPSHGGHVVNQPGLEQEQEPDVKRPEVVITRPSNSSIQSSSKSSNDNHISTATTSNEKEKETFAAETSTAATVANSYDNASHTPSDGKPTTLSQTQQQQQQQQQQQTTIPAHNTSMITTTNGNYTPTTNTVTSTAPANNTEDDASHCSIFVRLSSNGQDIKIKVPTQPPYSTIAGLRKELSPHLNTLNASTGKTRASISKLIYLGRILSDQYVIVPLTSDSDNNTVARNIEDRSIPSLPPASPPSSITKHILHHHHHSNHQNQQQQKVYIQKRGVIQAMVTRS